MMHAQITASGSVSDKLLSVGRQPGTGQDEAAAERFMGFDPSHPESKLTTLSKDGLLLGRRAPIATGGAIGASDHGEPFKLSKSADQILDLVKRFCRRAENTLCERQRTHYAANF